MHIHVGSQITSLEPLTSAARRIVELVTDLRADGIALDHVDSVAVSASPMTAGASRHLTDYAAAIVKGVATTGLAVVLEPGRALVGAAGLLLTRVVDVKEYPGGPRFAILDAGMTELLRPALYGAFHRIAPSRRGPRAAAV